MIRVFIVDDHPALRAGLRTVFELEPGFGYAGESAGDEQLWPLLARADADVLLVDYHLPSGDGLQLCREARQRHPALRTLLYSAYVSSTLSLPAALAGIDAMVGKDAGARELFDAVRGVSRGERLLAAPPIAVLEEARERLDPTEQALVGILLDGATEAEAGDVLGLDPPTLDHTVRRMLAKLRVDVPELPA